MGCRGPRRVDPCRRRGRDRRRGGRNAAVARFRREQIFTPIRHAVDGGPAVSSRRPVATDVRDDGGHRSRSTGSSVRPRAQRSDPVRHAGRQVRLQPLRDRSRRRPHAGRRQGHAGQAGAARSPARPTGSMSTISPIRTSRSPSSCPPAARGNFHDAMHKLIDDLKSALPAVFQSEDYQTRRARHRRSVPEASRARPFPRCATRPPKKISPSCARRSASRLAPVKDGKVVPPDEFSAWPEAEAPRGAGDHRGAGEGARAYRAPDPAMGEAAARRSAPAQPRHREIRGRPVDRGGEGRISTTCRGWSHHIEAVRADLIENFAIFVTKATSEDETEAGRHSGPAIRSTATRSTCWSRQARRRPRRADRRGAAPDARQSDRPHRIPRRCTARC